MTMEIDKPAGCQLLDFRADAMVENLLGFASSICSSTGSSFFWLDRSGNPSNMLLLNIPGAMYTDYLSRINRRDPLYMKRITTDDDNRVVMLNDALLECDSKQVAGYISFLGDYEIGDEVNFIFRHESRPIAGLALMRGKGEAPFSGESYNWELMHRHFELVLKNHETTRAMVAEDRLVERFGLTKREREVVSLLTAGCSNVEIAESMGRSLATTKTHIANIYEKMGINNRASAVALALRFD